MRDRHVDVPRAPVSRVLIAADDEGIASMSQHLSAMSETGYTSSQASVGNAVSGASMDGAGINLDAAMEQHELAASAGGELRWLPLVGGGLLAGYGLAKPSFGGLLAAALGGGLAYYGMTGHRPLLAGGVPDGERSIRIEKVVTINRPISEVYGAWSRIEQLPRIMSHLESVTDFGDGRSRWVAKAPLGQTVEWDAEVINDERERILAWRSVGDASVPNVGAVHFHEAPGGRGTEVRVRIEYSPPAGQLGATIAKLFGEEPGQQVADDLRRFKQMLETGEIATTEGQPRGSVTSSVIGAALDKGKQVAGAAGSEAGAQRRPS
jgi:uncharacterized membrane protein